MDGQFKIRKSLVKHTVRPQGSEDPLTSMLRWDKMMRQILRDYLREKKKVFYSPHKPETKNNEMENDHLYNDVDLKFFTILCGCLCVPTFHYLILVSDIKSVCVQYHSEKYAQNLM